jgi:hypothetical protein
MYYLWHTQRQGWVTAVGNTTTNLPQALQVNSADAVQRVKAGASGADATPMVIPVSVPVLEQALDFRA